LLLGQASVAVEWLEGRLQLHGYYEMTLRGLADSYKGEYAYLSQWAHQFSVELEADIAPDGWGPFDLVSGYARLAVRYDCVWAGCGVFNTHKYFGDQADHAPARNWTDGHTSGFTGALKTSAPQNIHQGTRLVQLGRAPPLDQLIALGTPNLLRTFAPFDDVVVAEKRIVNATGEGAIPLGPWHPEVRIHSVGLLADLENPTSPLPLRPKIGPPSGNPYEAAGIYVPSAPLRANLDAFDNFDQNYNQAELEWNRGASQQDEKELKEAYLDVEMLDGRLWMRIGKQNIVWGKTELFRTTDQFNPQDIGYASLASLEETRIALWSARAVYSFFDVGPLEDVRLELAVNYDDFEPIDLGKCAEPYTVWLVCGKSIGLVGHSILGVGLAGEKRPPHPWDSTSGLEGGVRLEWRWGRFSFALVDFYGYNDSPTLKTFHFYERRVDPRTGRPLDIHGEVLDPKEGERERFESSVENTTTNRQAFDLICSATSGLVATLIPDLSRECLLDVANSQTVFLANGVPANLSSALSAILSGSVLGGTALSALTMGAPVQLRALNRDFNDGPFAPVDHPVPEINLLRLSGLSPVLTDFQEALLGCGPYYGTNCDVDGIDLLNAEASVLFQAFPGFEEGGPIATRFHEGRLLMLPGSRGPGDPDYDPFFDGCTSRADHPRCNRVGVNTLLHPVTGVRFRSELAALSYNFLQLLAALGSNSAADPDCDVTVPISCSFVRAVFGVVGIQNPDVRAGGNGRFGRRDFTWHAGGEGYLQYRKRNVLGFSLDFAEDVSKTNWSIESSWFDDEPLGVTNQRDGYREVDVYNLSVSIDRPTFVNFLNQNRTFFFNTQWFFKWIPEYERGGVFTGTDGPFSALATFTVATGYYQDRLLPVLTFVHDFSSASGGIIGGVTYRFTESSSISVGMASFYGGPEAQHASIYSLAPGNNIGNFKSRTRFLGLTSIAERDEVFLSLRVTF
jgi:hypothetical protein